ncbi:2'-5' RNA ligase family protein [Bordetella petrii]|nr:2'-5' RNA ligase family protein [Bordetella petrii]
MPPTALIIKSPEAEAVVAPLRTRYDPTSQLGVPAHITILFPFIPSDQITPAILTRLDTALNVVPAFSYSLSSIGTFEATTYLAPDPAQPFISLTSAVFREFPDFPPYGGQHAGNIPHLTVAHGDAQNAAIAAQELATRLRAHPVIQARCRAVTLLENSSGRWQELDTFDLRN